MDFDFISFILGAGAGVLGAAAVGRAKFSALQTRLRDAEDELRERVTALRNKR